jgi:hypothetical protein
LRSASNAPCSHDGRNNSEGTIRRQIDNEYPEQRDQRTLNDEIGCIPYVENEPQREKQLNLSSDTGAPWCYFGAAKDVVFHRPSLQDGLALCAPVTGTTNRPMCLRGVGEMSQSLLETPSERATTCRASADPAACRCGPGIGTIIPATLRILPRASGT